MIFISFAEICRYLEANTSSRNLTEGENVLNGGLIITCGTTKRSKDEVDILGLCLQTSALVQDPHTITGVLDICTTTTTENNVTIRNFKCTCKAGSSGKCKHVSAVLWHLNRNDILLLDDISVTDVKCMWAIKKAPSLLHFAPKPLSEFCHVNVRNSRTPVSEEFREKARERLLAAAPDSAVAKHRLGRLSKEHDEPVTCAGPSANKTLISTLIGNTNNTRLRSLPQQDYISMSHCCAKVYKALIVDPNLAIELCVDTLLSKQKWQSARQYRVTGSRCYDIFTYGSRRINWIEKAGKYFWPKTFSTKATRHGLTNERHARLAYMEQLKTRVEEIGFVVPPLHPWLGFSADGVVIERNIATKLLEIKCPLIGEQVPAHELLHLCAYIQQTETCFILKKKHKYYGQVQLGMAILNLDTCDFVLYSSFDRSIQVIRVDIDINFVDNMLLKLKADYFNNMIHHICLNNDENIP